MPLDNLKNVGKSIARGIVGKNLTRVAGGIAGLIGGPNRKDSSDISPLRSSTSTTTLSFPLDNTNVDPSLGNHGHYMMFFINEQESAKVRFDNMQDKLSVDGETLGTRNLKRHLEKNLGFTGSFDKIFDSKTGKFKEKPTKLQSQAFDGKNGPGQYLFGKDSAKYKKGFGGAALKTGDINKTGYTSRKNQKQTISIERPPTRRLDTCITMYMPAEVKVNYKADYSDTKIGSGTQLASQVLGQVANGASISAGAETLGNQAMPTLEAIGTNALGDVVGAIPVFSGAKEAYEMNSGVILTDRMELAFKGIGKRTFSYTFKMMPRSEDEANEVKRIVDMFKFHMLPEMTSGQRGRFMSYPSTFDIKYMFLNTENNYLNKVSECYLETMDVNYGGDRFRAHKGNTTGAPPIETSMTLTFKEIELITRDKAADGF